MPLRRPLRKAQDAGSFVQGDPGKEAQLNQFGFRGALGSKSIERLVDGEQLVTFLHWRGNFDVVQVDSLLPTAVSDGEFLSRSINENAAHGLGGGAEEVGAVFKTLLSQSQPRFVDERGGLERVAGLLAGHLRTGELPQFGIDLRDQGVRSIGLSAAEGIKEESDVGHVPDLPGKRGGSDAKHLHWEPATYSSRPHGGG